MNLYRCKVCGKEARFCRCHVRDGFKGGDGLSWEGAGLLLENIKQLEKRISDLEKEVEKLSLRNR